MTASFKWTPPADILEAGERARVGYRLGTTVAEGENTQKPIPSSLHTFRDWITARHPEVSSGGMRRSPPKPNTPGYRRDPHEEGIAIDFMTRDGDALANWLVLHAQDIGIQYVLWNRYEWSASHSGRRWEDYSGAEGHGDHIHMELSPEGISKTGPQMAELLGRLADSPGATPGHPPAEAAHSGSMVPAIAVVVAAAGLLWLWRENSLDNQDSR